MNRLMTLSDFFGLKFSDLVDIVYHVATKKSKLYESFDGSIDCYLVPDETSDTMSIEIEGHKSEKIQSLESLIKEASYSFQGIKNPQTIYCQIVTCELSRHYSHYSLYVYTRDDNDDIVVERLKKSLKGKGWAVRKPPKISVVNNTMTKRFINKMVKDTCQVSETKKIILKKAFEAIERVFEDDKDIVTGIYNSVLETGKVQLLNHHSPDRHDMRIRRKSARIVSEISKRDDLRFYERAAMFMSLKVLNLITGNASGSNVYDSRAFKADGNRILRQHRKNHPEVYNQLCKMYCLNPEDDNPIKSSLSSVVVECQKTGLFIKTPSRFKIFRDLERSVKENEN